ncbi:HicB family protein [Carboxydothermus islandicus]|uniref:HicB family protein n=2 Tax=Carboxydothermus TaxID=129957 RepID=A0A1L8CZ98_9THEO|nr:type II toxin-antitoxin system HicB family antitoxin [Carboxydothermus islandicus]GAV24223.1 HicB family protein [Carboxydothermus islandicus]
MYKDLYVFPAIFDYAEDGISVEFPDLPGCLTCGDNTEEALKNAKEALELHLYGMEKDNEPIPEPTPIDKIKIEPNQVLVLVEAWMPLVRSEMDNKAVKKTLTIPKWLNDLAEKKKINFSRVLQQALKEQLGIKEREI